MRFTSLLIAATTSLALAAPAFSATLFDIRLDSAQEVAPAGQQNAEQTGFGQARIVQNGGSASLAFNLFFDDDFDFGPILGDPAYPFTLPQGLTGDIGAASGLEVTRLHIHNAERGANGPVAFGLINPGLDQDGDITLDFANGATIISGEWDATEGAAGLTFNEFVGDLLAVKTGEDAPLYFNLHTANDPAGAIRGQLVAANDISAVPVPAALPLLLGGMAALGLLARRRTSKQA